MLPHRALLERVWSGDYLATPDYLEVFISQLRAKLARSGPRYTETERALGSHLVRPAEEPARPLSRARRPQKTATARSLATARASAVTRATSAARDPLAPAR